MKLFGDFVGLERSYGESLSTIQFKKWEEEKEEEKERQTEEIASDDLPFSSVQFSHLVVSDPLRPCESQHPRAPYPSPTTGVHSNSCPSRRWCHPASHPLLSPSPPTFSLSQHQGLFAVTQFFASDGQRIGVSASASVLPVNIQDWFPSGLTSSLPYFFFFN